MRPILLLVLALALPLVAAPPSFKPEDLALLARCTSLPIYVPGYLPKGLKQVEIEADYSHYMISYGDNEVLLWVQGIRREKPGDITFLPKKEGEVQIKIKHPVLGAGKLCWFPHREDGQVQRLEYSYGVLTKDGVTYDVGSTEGSKGTLDPREIQKFMQGLVLLKR